MNYTAISSINDTSAACHSILLEMGYTSYRGLCDDYPTSRVSAALVLGFYTLMVLACLIGLFYKQWKLKSNQTGHQVNYISIARNPALMILGTLTSYAFVIIQLLRVIISRKMYPCFLFSFTYWMAVPGLAAIVLGRCVRLIALTWMNQLKVKIGKRKLLTQSMELDITASSSSSNLVLDRSSMNVGGSSSGVELQSFGVSVSQSFSSIALVEEEPSDSNTKLDSSTTSGHTVELQIPVETPKRKTSKNSTNSQEISRLSSSKFDKQKLRMYRFFTSSKFIALLFSVIYGVHLIIYFAIGVADYYNAIFPQSARLTNSVFVLGTHLLSVEGCGNGTYNLVIMATYFGVYLVIGFALFAIALFMKNDVWKIKWELFLVVVGWLFTCLLYAIPQFFSDISTLVDYFVPWQLFIVFGCVWDTLIAHFIPVFIYQRNTSSSSSRDSQSSGGNSSNHIKKCLTSKKWNSKFLSFNEKSYCPEDVMMWNAIEQFKMIKSNKKRVELFRTIVKTYLILGSPLELNIARSASGIPEIMELYNSMNETNLGTISVSISVFNEIQQVCEHNMIDSFLRFHSEYKKELDEELGIKLE